MPNRKRLAGLSENKTHYRAAAPATSRLPELPPPEVLPNGTVRFVLKLGAKGRVVLPLDMRAAMGLEEGAIVLAWLKDGKVSLESQQRALKRIQQENRRLASGRSVVDEFIAERRAAARRGD
jgi:bifunctional DNA-binding transcriptional regulator/antitoxin component of YhaV-PrlF toxin-antitoxin module